MMHKTFIFLFVWHCVLHSHDSYRVIVNVPDTLKSDNLIGEIKLGLDLLEFDSNGLDSVKTLGLEHSGLRLSVQGFYTIEDSIFFNYVKIKTLHPDSPGFGNYSAEIIANLDFLVKGPTTLISKLDTTVYRFLPVEMEVRGNPIQGRPIIKYNWDVGYLQPRYLNADSSRIEVTPVYAGTSYVRGFVGDSLGRGFPKKVTLNVIEQPEVYNQINWSAEFEGSSDTCGDIQITFVESQYLKSGEKLSLNCGSMDTLYFGRAEAQREIKIESPGYYIEIDTLCQLCDCTFNGFDQNPAQQISCDIILNKGPRAVASADDTVYALQYAFLDASQSQSHSVDRPILSYSWFCDSDRSTATCPYFGSSKTSEKITRILPMDTGGLVITLVAFDVIGQSATDEIFLRVEPKSAMKVKFVIPSETSHRLKSNTLIWTANINWAALVDEAKGYKFYNLEGKRINVFREGIKTSQGRLIIFRE